jgi:hypothetical protein
VVPVKPIAEIRLHLLLRNTTGQAWFAEPRLRPTPVALTRSRAVAGLWGPHSLSLRAETNVPAEFEIEGLSTGVATQPALAGHSFVSVECAHASPLLLAGPIAVQMRDPVHPEENLNRVLVPVEAAAGEPPWRAWMVDSLARVFADALPPAETLEGKPVPLVLDAPRDGHVSVQVAIAANPHGPDQAVDVQVGDLIGENGVLAGTRWQRYRVGFIRNEKPARHPCLEHAGPAWWPDPLLAWGRMSVPPGQTRSAVLSVRVPKDQPPGSYRGHARIEGAHGRTQLLALELHVHPFTLPERPRIKTAFALMDGFLEKIYGHISPELRRAYTAFVLDHRLNPDDISRTRLPDLEELQWARGRGLNAFCVLNLVPEPTRDVPWVCYAGTEAYTAEFQRRLIERLDAFVPELEKRGLLDMAYVYGFDERGPEYIPIIRDYFGLIKQRYPRLRTLSTCWPPAGTDPASLNIDWYCPLASKYDPEEARKARARGGEMWWYICMGPTWPYANWLFEYPLAESRVIWWQAWQQQCDGFLYWGLNIWDRPRNDKPIPDDADALLNWSVTPFEPLHGDGVLLYPGAGGPLGSLRLLAIRDGIEDSMLLDAAEARIGRERVERIVRQVSRGMTDFERSPVVLHATRRAVLAELDGP